MGEILKFPGEATKLGFSRARKRGRCASDPNQLDLFVAPPTPITSASPVLSAFEQALLSDERGDDRAAELYAKAVENDDCAADALCNLGIIESKKGNAAKAFDCFTSSLKHDPRHAQAHYNLANLYFEVNDFRLAQLHYELAVEVDPAFANAYFNLALAQSLNQELATAIATLVKYQQMVSADEAHHADELLLNFRKILASIKDSHVGS